MTWAMRRVSFVMGIGLNWAFEQASRRLLVSYTLLATNADRGMSSRKTSVSFVSDDGGD